ncbi:MAG TPA: 30S ribosome-binding factor RbfA [Ruminococcaceae bacterium]|nr:30S ribosome-binding factor RbfA [Oscillospiraceae bacterium]
MPNFKSMRTAEDIRRELTDIFRSLKDPRISGFLTIVKVDVSADLSYAKVYVSAMEGIEKAKESVVGLKSAAGFIRRELGLRLQMRKSPELKFIADDSIEHSAELLKLIEKANEE